MDTNEIYLLRHAQSDNNAGNTKHYDSDVTAKGKRQAHEVALYLQGRIDGFVGIVSPFLRCLQTMLPVYRMSNIKVKVNRTAGESPAKGAIRIYSRNRSGDFAKEYEWGLEHKTIDNNHGQSYFDFTGETEAQYQDRLDRLISYLPKKVVIVTHRTPIHTIVKKICGVDLPDDAANASLTYIRGNELVEYNKVVWK